MKVHLLALISHQVQLAVKERYIKSYHPIRDVHAEVYIDRIGKNAKYPWILNVEGTVQLDNGGYEWVTQFDITTEKWSPIRYFFGGHIYFMDVED